MSDWYYAADNEQKGPVNESELKAYFATHKLTSDTLVWREGMENWTPANQVPAFSFRQPPMPAKVQPPGLGGTPAQPAPLVTSAAATPGSNLASVTPVTGTDLMGTPEALEVDYDDAEKNKVFGILAYLGILFLVPLLAVKDSPYAKYHANQGLVLFILEMVMIVSVNIITLILSAILPSFGIISVFFDLLYLGLMILVILGIVNAAQGKCVPLPLIGGVKLIK